MSQWKNQFNTTTLSDFVSAFFKGSDIHKAFKPSLPSQFGKTLMVPVRDKIVAKIELSIQGIHEQYVGFNISIIHADNGEIDSIWMDFNDYMKVPAGTLDGTLKIIKHCGCDWYSNGPTKEQIKFMISKMIEYIKHFT